MWSSSAIRQVYVRPDEQRRKGDRPDPDGRSEEHVDEDEPPREVRAPLQLSETHLEEQEHEHSGAEGEETRRPLAPRGEVAEAEQEGEQEDADDHRVDVNDGLEAAEPVDLVRGSSPGMRPGGSREGAADDQDERRGREAVPEAL